MIHLQIISPDTRQCEEFQLGWWVPQTSKHWRSGLCSGESPDPLSPLDTTNRCSRFCFTRECPRRSLSPSGAAPKGVPILNTAEDRKDRFRCAATTPTLSAPPWLSLGSQGRAVPYPCLTGSLPQERAKPTGVKLTSVTPYNFL